MGRVEKDERVTATIGGGRRRTFLVAVAVLVAGCGGNGGTAAQPSSQSSTLRISTSTTTAVSPGRWLIETSDADAGGRDTPMLLVTEGPEVTRLASGRVSRVGAVEGTAGVAVGDGLGTVVVEVVQSGAQGRPVPVRLVRFEDGRTIPLDTAPADQVHLYDAVIVNGASHILYGAARLPDDDEPSGDVVFHNLAAGKRRGLVRAFGPEFFTHRGSAAADIIVTSASSDLTETFAFHRFDGSDAGGWRNPTDGLGYNMPPSLTDAVLSPAGDRLAYLSGPDWDGTTQQRVGRWELVVVASDGKEIHRLALARMDRELTRLDFNGQWAVISSTSPDGTPQPPLLIDTRADHPVGRILSAVVGTATIDSAAHAGGRAAASTAN